ncbi:MAG: flavin reductase family protein [Dehalococcoidia bacterium]
MDNRRIAPMMGLLWSPLAAITSSWQGKANAQIGVSIGAASIVPQRPRLLVQIYKGNYSHDLVYHSRAFAVNFLRKDQLQLIKDFGFVSGRDRDKLAGVDYQTGASGSPVLKECWGYLDCRVVNALDGGDMTCFLGEVLAGDTFSDEGPLYWRDARREIPQEWNDEWDRRISIQIENSLQWMNQIDYSPWRA